MSQSAGGRGGEGAYPLLACVLLFATTLGVTAVAFPLRALAAGYDLAMVGYFAAIGAACQVIVRTALPWVLRSVPDRWLIRTSCCLMGASPLVLFVSTAPAAFVASAILLSVARALFWTASQVYVLHGDIDIGQRHLSYIQFLSATGEFLGPLLGGFVAQESLDAVLWLWAGGGLAGLLPATLLARFPPLGRVDRRHTGPVWRQRDVLVGAAAVGTAGGWRGLLSSLVPAVLAEAGRSAGQVGVVVALANASSMASTLLAGRVPARRLGVIVPGAILATGLGVGTLGLVSESVVLAAVVLTAGGFGCGLLQTLGTVLAAATVAPHQRGNVVVFVGLVRSAALMALPAAVGALVGALATPLALLVGGGLLIAPMAIGRRSTTTTTTADVAPLPPDAS